MIFYIKQHKLLIFLEILVATSRAGCDVMLSFAMGRMTDAAVNKQIVNLIQATISCGICLILLYVLYLLETNFRKQLSGKCLCNIKSDIYTALIRGGVANFHKQTDSYYLNLLQGDIDLLERNYFESLWRCINLSIQIVFCVIALITVSPKLFVIFAVVSIFPQLTSRLFRNYLVQPQNTFSVQNSQCIQKSKEFIGGFDTILFFSKQKTFISRLIHEDKILEERRKKKDVRSAAISYGATTVNMIAQIICMATVAYFVATGELYFGALTTSTQLLNYTFIPLNTVITGISSIISTRGIRKKFFDLIRVSYFQQHGTFCNGDICFDKVTVGYDRQDILKDFSCCFQEGKKYAIIGASGTGKSTLARALMGASQIRNGKIYIGGVDVQEIPALELYKNVLYIPQDTFLFEGTVLENISFFGEDQLAKASALRAALPEDLYNAQAGGDRGKALSGGEMTRLSIARALCSSASVLIFDEPTSGLDPSTALEIENMIQSISEKTVLVITHNWDPQYLDRFDDVIKI